MRANNGLPIGWRADVRVVELDAVHLSYGNREILRDARVRVEPGERVAIVGSSGSGKTSILRLIAGFLPPEKGVVRVGEEVVARDGRILTPPEARGVGMVFQDLALWPHLSVRGNLAFGLRAGGVERHERDSRVREALEMVGLGAFAEARPTTRLDPP